jgi:hypothetical protein
MAQHRVRLHTWTGGLLKTIDHFFEDVESALGFAKTQDANIAKVYDSNDQLVQAIQPAPTETYA